MNYKRLEESDTDGKAPSLHYLVLALGKDALSLVLSVKYKYRLCLVLVTMQAVEAINTKCLL